MGQRMINNPENSRPHPTLTHEPRGTPSYVAPSLCALLLSTALAVFGCSTSLTSISNEASQLDTEVRHAPRGVFSQDVAQESEAIHSYLLGEIELQKQNKDSAIEYFARAKDLFQEPTPTIEGTLADLYLAQGRIPEALTAVDTALKDDPENPDYLLLRASLLHSLGQTQDARAAYAHYLKIDPKGFNGQLLSGLLELLDTSVTDHFNTALQRFDAALAIRPQNSLALFLRARALEGLHKLPEATTALEQVLAQEPKNPAAFVDLIRLLAQQGQAQDIRSRTEKMVADDPDHQAARRVLLYLSLEDRAGKDPIERLAALTPSDVSVADIRFRLALAAIRAQDSQSALRELRLVLAEEPLNADARYNIAAILSSSGDIDGAVAELEQVPQSSPLFSKSRTFGAFLLRQVRQHARAEKSLREALRADPNDRQIQSFLVILLRESGELKEARSIVEAQLESDPNNEKLLFSYATLLNDLEDAAGALAAMERVLAINAENADALNFVAFSLAERGIDLDRAETLATRALRIRPNDGYFLDTLGWVHFRRGDFSSAEEVLRLAAQNSGDDPEILEHYGDTLVRLNKRTEARRVFQMALEKIQDAGGSESERTRARVVEKLQSLTEE